MSQYERIARFELVLNLKERRRRRHLLLVLVSLAGAGVVTAMVWSGQSLP